MKISPKTKKALKFLALGGVLFAGYRYGTPAARFRRDANNPSTSLGATFAGWPPAERSKQISVHIADAASPLFAPYKAKGWAITQ